MPQIQIETVRMVEIAQRLGVASSTISRALRDDPRISLELRKRVRVAADELGYKPNPLVSALMANRRRRGSGGAVDVIALVTNYGGKHPKEVLITGTWHQGPTLSTRETDSAQRHSRATGSG